jgi:hypothetical protein
MTSGSVASVVSELRTTAPELARLNLTASSSQHPAPELREPSGRLIVPQKAAP